MVRPHPLVEPLLHWWRTSTLPQNRPWVTLSYAQSVDGAIARVRGHPTALSGPESLRMTHALRAVHDGILVGIGTVLSDDPQLTVRLVEGPHPQPIVLDSRLRFPPKARLFRHPRKVWLASTSEADGERRALLESLGATVLTVAQDNEGQVHLGSLLRILHRRGIRTLMVEGGAQVITAFLQQDLVDAVVLTICPRYLGGVRVPEGHLEVPRAFSEVTYRILGEDVVLWGRLI